MPQYATHATGFLNYIKMPLIVGFLLKLLLDLLHNIVPIDNNSVFYT